MTKVGVSALGSVVLSSDFGNKTGDNSLGPSGGMEFLVLFCPENVLRLME